MLDGNKVMITVALNGGMQQDRDGAIVPKQPDEIGEAAARCWEAGASVVHVHARGPDGKNSGDPAIYAEIIRQIRARSPILIQTTNGIGVRRDPATGQFIWPTDSERLGLLEIEPQQDLFGIAGGSADFHNPDGGYPEETPYVNSPQLLRRTIEGVYAKGSALEYEIVEASSLHRLMRYAEEGLFDRHRENIWLLHGGGFGATPPIARNVIFNIDEGLRMFPQAIWGVTATGRHMFRIVTLGLAMGCDLVRVGFEDGLHLPDGSVARDNAEMVRAAADIAAIYGLQPASVDEARAVRNMTGAAESRALARAAVAVCTAIYFLDGLIHTILGPLAPDIARSLSLGNAELGPIFSSNLVGQCIGLVVFPAIATRFGHRLTVTLAVVGFALGQAASALADSGTSLFAIRLVTGIFLGGCLPSCLAIVTAQAPPKRRGLSILVLFTGYGLGAAIAGIVAAGFADFGGWRPAMVAVGAVSLLAALAAWLALRDDQAPGEDEAHGAVAGRPAALQILGSRYWIGTLMLWLLFVLMLTISYCLNSWLPIMLVQVGHSEAFAALSITIFGFGGAIAALGVGLLIDRFGAMPVLIGFLAAAAAALFATGQVIATASAQTLSVLLGAAGFFSLGAYGGVNVVLAGFYPNALRATGIGWAKSVGRLGTVIAPILIGFALSAGMSSTVVMSLFAVPAVLAVAALVAVSRTRMWREGTSVEPGQVPAARQAG